MYHGLIGFSDLVINPMVTLTESLTYIFFDKAFSFPVILSCNFQTTYKDWTYYQVYLRWFVTSPHLRLFTTCITNRVIIIITIIIIEYLIYAITQTTRELLEIRNLYIRGFKYVYVQLFHSDGQIQIMIWFKSRLNHNWWFDLTTRSFDLEGFAKFGAMCFHQSKLIDFRNFKFD